MNNKISWISLAIALMTLSALIATQVLQKNAHKQGFIVLKKVFDEFDMSKQYKKKMETVLLARKGIIDSLELNLKAESRTIQAGSKGNNIKDQFEFDRQYYLEKRKQFQEDNDALTKQYNEEVIKQMNQYIKDFGEKNGYGFLFGAEGSGVLMYANDKLDVTPEVIKYINERYKGNAK